MRFKTRKQAEIFAEIVGCVFFVSAVLTMQYAIGWLDSHGLFSFSGWARLLGAG